MSQAMMQAANQKPSPAHQVAVVGLGYSGPPTAAVLASSGWNVCGVDVSRRVVETVNAGGVHIEERDLDTLVQEVVAAQSLVASVEVPTASFYMIAVPTPLDDQMAPDIEDFRESPALEIAEALARSHGEHILLVEPVAEVLPAAFDGTGAKLVPLDPALREAEVVVVLVGHTACRHLGSDDLVGKLVYDARGMLSK